MQFCLRTLNLNCSRVTKKILICIKLVSQFYLAYLQKDFKIRKTFKQKYRMHILLHFEKFQNTFAYLM